MSCGKLFCLQCKECGTSTKWSKELRELRCSLFGNDEQSCRIKHTNPKDAVGTRKVSMSCVPARVLAEVANALHEGARKYGRHKYRVSGVRASVYYDASLRHLMQWFEGEDIDADSGISHVSKAIAGLIVLRDSMMQGNWVDDRPPACEEWITEQNKKASDIIDRYPNAIKPCVNKKGR